MQILLASPIHQAATADLSRRHEVTRISSTPDVVGDPGLATCEVLVVRSGVTISRQVLHEAPKLQLVVRAGSGLDNLDLRHLEERGIGLVRVPGPGARAVAELTLALALAVGRRIAEADRQVRLGQWRKHELTGPLLEGRTLGIIGAGNIGSVVGQLGSAWGMRAVGCIEGDSDAARARTTQAGIELASFDTCVSAADILTIHVPLTPATRHLVNGGVFDRLRPGSIIINTARGGVMDEDALYSALASGHVAGAGLDVHERESDGSVPRLAEFPNVVLTPHIGAMASDAQRQIGMRVVELINAHERGILSTTARPDEVVLRTKRHPEGLIP